MPMLGKFAKNRLGAEKFLQERKGERANQCAAQMAQAAQNNNDQYLARDMPAHHFRVHKTVFYGKQKPRQSGDTA